MPRRQHGCMTPVPRYDPVEHLAKLRSWQLKPTDEHRKELIIYSVGYEEAHIVVRPKILEDGVTLDVDFADIVDACASPTLVVLTTLIVFKPRLQRRQGEKFGTRVVMLAQRQATLICAS